MFHWLSANSTEKKQLMCLFLIVQELLQVYANFSKPVIKNTNLEQKITHMWRMWHTPQNFFLAFIDELGKQIIITKTVEVSQ